MIRKLILPITQRICRTGASLWPGLGLLLLIPLLAGCPFYEESYHVYYEGNGNTAGYPPVDSQVYFPGDKAIVFEKPEDLKKGTLEFLGWQQSGRENLLQPGDIITISYENIRLYARWEGDPNYNPYGYTADPQNGGVIITSYSQIEQYTSDITIPETLGGAPVTAIGEEVFAGKYYISSIVLPSQLVSIGNKAFAGTALAHINIPNAVRSIGKLAFQNCYLESVRLGGGLESIDAYAFDNNFLTALFLPVNISFVGEGAFSGNKLISIEIGGNVTIKSDTSLGTYGASFRSYYAEKSSRGGVYLYNNGTWRGPYSE